MAASRVCTYAAGLALFTVMPHTLNAQTPLGTAFTYQGQLKESGKPVNDTCFFEFSLWDAATNGNLVAFPGPPLGIPLLVRDGLFESLIDFGPGLFTGEARFLEVAVFCSTDGPPPITLAPRQELTPAPYSLRASNGVGGPDALNVDAADNVGIGTPSPVATLHVDGSAVFRGPGPWADVRAFGAKGDGQTDDTAAIQAAIDSLQGTCLDGFCVGGSNDSGTCGLHVDCPDDPSSTCNTGIGLCEGGRPEGWNCITDEDCQVGTCSAGTLLCEGGLWHCAASPGIGESGCLSYTCWLWKEEV